MSAREGARVRTDTSVTIRRRTVWAGECRARDCRQAGRASWENGVLSGGEQQMLTLCRTLMGDPDLIMIDEPTEGLAPKIVELVGVSSFGRKVWR